MTRQRSDKPQVRRQERPEPLGRPRAYPSAERLTAAIERQQHGYGPPSQSWTDAYPDAIGAHDAAQLRREERFRARELGDLADSGMVW